MQMDLEFLPAWYAEKEDFVYVTEKSSALYTFLSDLPLGLTPATPVTGKELQAQAERLPALKACPWGISPQSLNLFEHLRKQTHIRLSVPEWEENYFRLSGRQTAAECLNLLQARLPEYAFPEAPRFYTNAKEITNDIAKRHPPLLLKTPFSSSGRGLLWIKENIIDKQAQNWINGALLKQGTVSIERGLNKVLDFAMEFYSNGKGRIEYEGLSVFKTGERGAYDGNLLEEQTAMRLRITRYVAEKVLLRTKEALQNILEKIYAPFYKGCIGVDMLIYRMPNGTFALHPCVEINMRYTMGMVALRLYQKRIARGSAGEFRVVYDKKEGEALSRHQRLSEEHPLKIQEGHIQSGYLSLCPVTQTTRYRAYLLIR